MTARPSLPAKSLSPKVAEKMATFHADVLQEIETTIARDRVVVVGMAQNPHVKNVRRALKNAGVEFTYLEYGSYFSKWKERLAIKLWSGWPTFPQVFINGTLIGGEDLTVAALAQGEFAPA